MDYLEKFICDCQNNVKSSYDYRNWPSIHILGLIEVSKFKIINGKIKFVNNKHTSEYTINDVVGRIIELAESIKGIPFTKLGPYRLNNPMIVCKIKDKDYDITFEYSDENLSKDKIDVQITYGLGSNMIEKGAIKKIDIYISEHNKKIGDIIKKHISKENKMFLSMLGLLPDNLL